MFFIFSKILYFLITPICWIAAAIILAFIFRKKTFWLKFFIVSAIAIVLVFSNSAFYTFVIRKWEIPAVAPQHFKGNYKYAIVLGGMASSADDGKLHVGPSIDRILTAITLYHKGQIEKILITGGSGLLTAQEAKEAPAIELFCIQMKVDEEDIIIEPESRNTYENAVFTKNLIGTPQEKVLLITSASHMRRSIGCFKKQGFKFDLLSADPSGEPQLYFDDYFIPKAEPLMKWNYLIKEWIGYYAYKAAGYIE